MLLSHQVLGPAYVICILLFVCIKARQPFAKFHKAGSLSDEAAAFCQQQCTQVI